jgi:hypothetical protein
MCNNVTCIHRDGVAMHNPNSKFLTDRLSIIPPLPDAVILTPEQQSTRTALLAELDQAGHKAPAATIGKLFQNDFDACVNYFATEAPGTPEDDAAVAACMIYHYGGSQQRKTIEKATTAYNNAGLDAPQELQAVDKSLSRLKSDVASYATYRKLAAGGFASNPAMMEDRFQPDQVAALYTSFRAHGSSFAQGMRSAESGAFSTSLGHVNPLKEKKMPLPTLDRPR